MNIRRLARSGYCGILALAWINGARADQVDPASRSAARKLGYAGIEAYQAGDYASACDKLERAYEVLRVPTLGMWSARCLAKQSKLVEASERYLEVQRLDVAADAAVQKRAQADAANDYEKLSPRIPTLRIRVEGRPTSEIRVLVDDVPIASSLIGEARPVDPGPHRVLAIAGTARIESVVTLQEAEQKLAVLNVPAAPVASSPRRDPSTPVDPAPPARIGASEDASPGASRAIGWTALGVGGAALALGGVAAGMMRATKDTIGACPDNRCVAGQESNVAKYNSWRTVSSLSFIAGGVLAVTGLTLVVVARGGERGHSALVIGPQSLEWSSQF